LRLFFAKIGSGKRSRAIPQMANSMNPNETSAIPEAFCMAAIVTVAHMTKKPLEDL
jgi:hypothetical protein